jgi:NADH-quinone oxidoreductase subunit E
LSEKELKTILARYPNKKAALLPILRVIQKKVGYISTEVERYVAQVLDMHLTRVHEVVTFYSWLREKPAGKNLILVCESISCSLQGAEEIVEHLQKTLGINVGETTADNLFTLETVDCLSQCEHSPSIMVNDEIVAPATVEEIDRRIADISK